MNLKGLLPWQTQIRCLYSSRNLLQIGTQQKLRLVTEKSHRLHAYIISRNSPTIPLEFSSDFPEQTDDLYFTAWPVQKKSQK